MRTAPLRALAAGRAAHAALLSAGGVARVSLALPGSVYCDAGGALVWLGGPDAMLHPRAVRLAAVPPAVEVAWIDVSGIEPWRPPAAARVARVADAWSGLVRDLARVGAPAGFGPLVVGRPPHAPFERAAGSVRALARACRAGDASRAALAARALLGLGSGLTPSGDDVVGAAFLARRWVAHRGHDAAWQRASREVEAAARAVTHPLSATLLADCLAGESHASLHDLLLALAVDQPEAALDAGRRLVGIGHSSGWDMLAGAGAGLGALG